MASGWLRPRQYGWGRVGRRALRAASHVHTGEGGRRSSKKEASTHLVKRDQALMPPRVPGNADLASLLP